MSHAIRGQTVAILSQVVLDLQARVDPESVSHQLALHQVVQDAVADTPACVLVADDTGRLVAASRQALTILGHTLKSLRGLNVTDVAGPEEQEIVEPLWESFLRQRRQSGSFMLRRKDGTSVATQYSAQANAVAGLSIAVHLPVNQRPTSPPAELPRRASR